MSVCSDNQKERRISAECCGSGSRPGQSSYTLDERFIISTPCGEYGAHMVSIQSTNSLSKCLQFDFYETVRILCDLFSIPELFRNRQSGVWDLPNAPPFEWSNLTNYGYLSALSILAEGLGIRPLAQLEPHIHHLMQRLWWVVLSIPYRDFPFENENNRNYPAQPIDSLENSPN